MTPAAPLRDRLQALGAFVDELEAPGFDAGRWHDSEVRQTPDGEVRTMPWFELSERAEAFTRAAAGNGWVQPFDWMAWIQTDEERRSATIGAPSPTRCLTSSNTC
jgi:hypothetical protein